MLSEYKARVLGESLNGNIEGKDMETSVAADETLEVKLAPQDGTKEEEYVNPLNKPLMLDDGRWAVFSWYFIYLFPTLDN